MPDVPPIHRVLLVDDDLPFCEAVTRLLAHHRVEATAAPAAALAMLSEGRFDLAIIDVRLWPIDGLELTADMLRRIRDDRGITIIWVEHIMGVLMRVVDRCIVLDHGEVIAGGKPSEVAHDPKVIEVYLGTDADAVQQQVKARGL